MYGNVFMTCMYDFVYILMYVWLCMYDFVFMILYV